MWDAFISHASEDKDLVVRPLTTILVQGRLRVWYDEFALSVGDSLRRSIDHGLANSRFGVVILSQRFFEKQWPQQELDGLISRESSTSRVVLPVWHNISRDDVAKYSPILADRIAVSTSQGLDVVAQHLLSVIKPSDKAPKDISTHPILKRSLFCELWPETIKERSFRSTGHD